MHAIGFTCLLLALTSLSMASHADDALIPIKDYPKTAEDRYADARQEKLVARLIQQLQPQFNRGLRDIEHSNGGRIVSPKGFRIRDTESHRVILSNGKTCVVMGRIVENSSGYFGDVISWDCF